MLFCCTYRRGKKAGQESFNKNKEMEDYDGFISNYEV